MAEPSPGASSVEVVDAATVICLRQSLSPKPSILRHSDFALNAEATNALGDFRWEFCGELEVLVGQSEVVNWVRSSSPEELHLMRYGGELKFPGGTKDQGEALIATARRELAEEFDIDVPESAVLRPFKINSTRAVKGRSYRMHNFACLADENAWLRELDVDAINARLASKREHFAELAASGEFWRLTTKQREAVSPEVHLVRWMAIRDVVASHVSSKGAFLQPVDEFQRSEFARLGVERRDPMFASMFVLRSVEVCGGTLETVRQAAQRLEMTQLETKRAESGGKEHETEHTMAKL